MPYRMIRNIWAIIILSSAGSCSQPAHKPVKRFYSGFSTEMVQPGWQSSEWSDLDCITVEGEKAKCENRFFLLSRWNSDSLYFFFKVEDTDLRAYQNEKDHPKLFLDDMVEILIDTQNDKDSCWAEDDIVYHVNILGVKKDDRGTKECNTDPKWDGSARNSVQLFGTLNCTTDIDTGYILSLIFPWEEIGRKPESGLIMGINFANGDNDGKGRRLFDWVGAWPMRSPYAFGNLILIGD